MHRLGLAALLAACYAPTAQPGAPCGPGGECPSGQDCRAGVCVASDSPYDAATNEDGLVDGPAPDATVDAPVYVAWSTPVELSTLETAGNSETDPSVTANKLTAVLSAESAPGDDEIWIATRTAVGDSFSGLALLSAVNATGFNDKSPEISADGATLYFTSNRSGTYQVYISTFSTVWSSPALRTDLSVGSTSDVALSPDGLTAAVLREGEPDRIWIHTRASTADTFGAGVMHGELNVTADIGAPSITNGGAVIYFHASTPRDLYRATRNTNGSYATPVAVTELNSSSARDAAPFLLQTDDYLIFERNSDIYETTR